MEMRLVVIVVLLASVQGSPKPLETLYADTTNNQNTDENEPTKRQLIQPDWNIHFASNDDSNILQGPTEEDLTSLKSAVSHYHQINTIINPFMDVEASGVSTKKNNKNEKLTTKTKTKLETRSKIHKKKNKKQRAGKKRHLKTLSHDDDVIEATESTNHKHHHNDGSSDRQHTAIEKENAGKYVQSFLNGFNANEENYEIGAGATEEAKIERVKEMQELEEKARKLGVMNSYIGEEPTQQAHQENEKMKKMNNTKLEQLKGDALKEKLKAQKALTKGKNDKEEKKGADENNKQQEVSVSFKGRHDKGSSNTQQHEKDSHAMFSKEDSKGSENDKQAGGKVEHNTSEEKPSAGSQQAGGDKKKNEKDDNLDLDNPEKESKEEKQREMEMKKEEEKDYPSLEPDEPTGWQKVVVTNEDKGSKQKGFLKEEQLSKERENKEKENQRTKEEETQQVEVTSGYSPVNSFTGNVDGTAKDKEDDSKKYQKYQNGKEQEGQYNIVKGDTQDDSKKEKQQDKETDNKEKNFKDEKNQKEDSSRETGVKESKNDVKESKNDVKESKDDVKEKNSEKEKDVKDKHVKENYVKERNDKGNDVKEKETKGKNTKEDDDVNYKQHYEKVQEKEVKENRKGKEKESKEPSDQENVKANYAKEEDDEKAGNDEFKGRKEAKEKEDTKGAKAVEDEIKEKNGEGSSNIKQKGKEQEIEQNSRIVLDQLKQLQKLAKSSDPDPNKIDVGTLHPATVKILKKLDNDRQRQQELNSSGLMNKMMNYQQTHNNEDSKGKKLKDEGASQVNSLNKFAGCSDPKCQIGAISDGEMSQMICNGCGWDGCSGPACAPPPPPPPPPLPPPPPPQIQSAVCVVPGPGCPPPAPSCAPGCAPAGGCAGPCAGCAGCGAPPKKPLKYKLVPCTDDDGPCKPPPPPGGCAGCGPSAGGCAGVGCAPAGGCAGACAGCAECAPPAPACVGGCGAPPCAPCELPPPPPPADPMIPLSCLETLKMLNLPKSERQGEQKCSKLLSSILSNQAESTGKTMKVLGSLLKDDGCSLDNNEKQVAAKLMGQMMSGGCCGSCAAAAQKPDPEDLAAAADYLKCKENGAFEKLISLGPEHCANDGLKAKLHELVGNKKTKVHNKRHSRHHTHRERLSKEGADNEKDDDLVSKFLLKTKHRNVASRRTKTERSKKRSSQQKQRKVHPKFKRVFKKPTTENNDITYDNDDSENEAESFQRRSGIPVTLKKSKKPKPAEVTAKEWD